MARYPDFLFIGAMKSATTTISEQLGVQPGIFMVSDPKELYFFSQNDVYEQGINWYTSHFEQVPQNELCGEAATTYSQIHSYPDAAKRLHQHLPDAKLIYLMRHPIDRLISHYIHEVTCRNITVDINTAIYDHPDLVKTSQYAMQLQAYFEYFVIDQIMPSFFERLKSDSQAELERICSFIGYEGKPQWDYELKAKNVSKERVIETPFITFLTNSPLIQPIRQYLLPTSLKAWGREKFFPRIDERPEINPEGMAYLKSVFDEDLALLGEWMGVSLTCDTFSSVVSSSACTWNTSTTQHRPQTETLLK